MAPPRGSALRVADGSGAGRARQDAMDRGAAAIQCHGLVAIPVSGLPPPAVQPKQRVGSNGTPSRITWKQARASLWATALRATTLCVRAFLRW